MFANINIGVLLVVSLGLPLPRSVKGCKTLGARNRTRILAQGGLKIRGWGQARHKRPRTGVAFLARRQPAPSPPAREHGGAL